MHSRSRRTKPFHRQGGARQAASAPRASNVRGLLNQNRSRKLYAYSGREASFRLPGDMKSFAIPDTTSSYRNFRDCFFEQGIALSGFCLSSTQSIK